MLIISEPMIIEREPYKLVGIYHIIVNENEGAAISGADNEFLKRLDEVINRKDDLVLSFYYRPHKDNPDIAGNVKSWFTGAEVTNFDQIPKGMATTEFPGGKYVIVECRSDIPEEISNGLNQAFGSLETWLPEHGYASAKGDACFVCAHEKDEKPPYIEYLYKRIEKQS